MRRAFLTAVVVIGFATPAGAGFGEDWQYCGKETNPDVTIEACTEVIHAGQLNNDNLAFAFYSRGTAYQEKGDYDSAIKDYNQANRLRPATQ